MGTFAGASHLLLVDGESRLLLVDGESFLELAVDAGDVPVATLLADAPPAVLGLRTPPVVYPNPEDEPGWSVFVVDRFGTVLGELVDVNVGSIDVELNRPGSASLTVPKGSAGAALLEWGREIQVWRNEQLLWWGPITRVSGAADGGGLAVQCSGLLWYLDRRHFGTAERVNKLTNGGFEGSLVPWAAVNLTADYADTGAILRGDGVAVLYGRTDPNAYLTQTQVFEHTWPFGQRLTVSAWCHISDGDWSGPAVVTHDGQEINPGIMVVVRTWPGGDIERVNWAPVDEDTPRDRWVRLETFYTVAPFQTNTVEVRLYGVDGTIRWDECRAAVMESTSGDPDGTDQAEYVRRIVHYAQHGRGKSPLNLQIDAPATGVVVPHKAWQHADHAPIMGAIREFTESRDGVDVSVEVTPVTRTLTVHYPAQGVDRSGSVTLSTSTNVATISYDADIARAATSVVVLGPADGPTREEGGAIDTSALGGLVLEDVYAAPPEVSIRQLDEYAQERVAVAGRPVEVLEAVVTDRSLIGVLGVGDRVSVSLSDGWLVATGVWRVVRLAVDGPTETLRVALNPWGES